MSGEARLRYKGKAAAAALQAGTKLSEKSRNAKFRVLARTWWLLSSSLQVSISPLLPAGFTTTASQLRYLQGKGMTERRAIASRMRRK